jgi:large subunit ribosomal protein L3
MVKDSHPHRGSLAFYPRKRASRIYPSITTYPLEEKAKILGFAGYKVAMAHAVAIDNNKGSNTFGQEIIVPVTVVECPPMVAVGVRAYKKTTKGLTSFTHAITTVHENLKRKIIVGKFNSEKNLSEIEKNLGKVAKIRVIVATQPHLTGIRKKKPEIFEIEIGGKDAKENFELAKQILGKEIKITDIFKEGELVDVVAVTKGKGTQGVVKRFGVKIQNRHAMKKKRHIGTLGPQTPRRVRWTAPQAGQMGFQTRTELNKRILKVGNADEINIPQGFNRYGKIKSNYILVEGSIPGSKKRLVRMRPAIRPTSTKIQPIELKQIVLGG